MAVAFDAAGGGWTQSTTVTTASGSWSHTAASGATVIVGVFTVVNNAAHSTFTCTATYNGVAMTPVVAVDANYSAYGWVQFFSISGVAAGAKTVAVSVSGSASVYCAAANSLSYTGVNGVTVSGTNANNGTALSSGPCGATTGQMVVQGFAYGNISGAISLSGYNQTLRYSPTVTNGTNSMPVAFGDAAGASSLSFTDTGSTAVFWSSVAVLLSPTAPKGTLFTVDGTAYAGAPTPFPNYINNTNFATACGYGVNASSPGVWNWVSIGYPAATLPMGASVTTGATNLAAAISASTGPFALVGYSQGAMVTGTVWANDILEIGGSLASRLTDCKGVFNFGDPFRCPGIANGNTLAGLALPAQADGVTTGGISGPGDLTATQTPGDFYSFALDGDLYACCPVGDDPQYSEACVGFVETGVYNIIQTASVIDIFSVAEDLLMPGATIQAIINGLTFFTAGTGAAHYQYGAMGCVTAAITELVTIGAGL